jgi:GxxExxY protein
MIQKPELVKHHELTETIIGVFFDTYNELGYGFLESVYKAAMLIALRKAGLAAEVEVPVTVWFQGESASEFRADILVESKVLLELKATRSIDLAFEKQILNYLRATDLEVGLLFNFGPKAEFRRYAFENENKKIRVLPRTSAAKGSK